MSGTGEQQMRMTRVSFFRLSRRGFTMIEMMVVISIVLIVMAALLPRLFDTVQGDYTKQDAEDALNLMMTAQTFAATNRDDSNWGIHMVDNGTTDCNSTTAKDCLVLYKGTDYAARDSSYDQIFTLHGTNRWANTDDSDFYFQKFSGHAQGLYGFPSGLAAYWPLTASSTVNVAATGTPGTISGETAYLTNGCANDSGCFEFGPGGGYINEGDGNDLNVGTGAFSLTTWFKITSIDDCDVAHVVGKRLAGATGSWYRIYLSDDDCRGAPYVYFEVGENYPTNLTSAISNWRTSVGEWHHAAAVRDGKNGYLYVDGALQTSVADLSGYGTLDNTNWFGIGQYAAISDRLNGAVDDVMLFKRTLSSDEVLQIFNTTRPTSTLSGERTSNSIKITNGASTSTIQLFANGAGHVTGDQK